MFGQDEGHQCTPTCTSYAICSNMRDAESMLVKLSRAWCGCMNYIRTQCYVIDKGDIGDVLIDNMTTAVLPYADTDVKIAGGLEEANKLLGSFVGFTNELDRPMVTVTVGFALKDFFDYLIGVDKKIKAATAAARPPSKITADEVTVTAGGLYTAFRSAITAEVKAVIAHVATKAELNNAKAGLATYSRLVADGVKPADAIKEAVTVVSGKVAKRKGGSETGCKGH
jgi:hypothetical protein